MNSRSRRFVFRFRMQTILVLVTAFIILIGLVTQEIRREHRKKGNADEIRRLGGRVHDNPRPEFQQTGIVNGYLRVILGDKYFTEIDSVFLKPNTEADVELLHAFPEIMHLSLLGASINDNAIERIGPLLQLDNIYINGAQVGERGLKSLAKLPKLTSLRFEDCSLADQCLIALKEFANLRSLEFTNCLISDDCLKSLSQLADLSLSLRKCSLSDADLKLMHGGRESVKLNLFMTNVTEAGILAIREANPNWSIQFSGPPQAQLSPREPKGYLPSIREFQHTEKLTFQGPLTSDATLAILKDAPKLSSLEFYGCSLTDAGLLYLEPLQSLRSLTISGSPLTDEGVRALNGLAGLQSLYMAGTKIEGRGLGSLPSSLKKLGVSLAEANDSGIAEIAKLTSLEELYLLDSIVSDEELDEIAKMSSLLKLHFWQTPVSDANVSRLRQALPNCTIATD